MPLLHHRQAPPHGARNAGGAPQASWRENALHASARASPRTAETYAPGGIAGASVEGLDLSCPVDDATLQDLRAAFLAHLVLVFPDLYITPDQHAAFARRWGPVQVMPGRHLPGYPEVEPCSRSGTIGMKAIG